MSTGAGATWPARRSPLDTLCGISPDAPPILKQF
jgi:hypothetical protein